MKKILAIIGTLLMTSCGPSKEYLVYHNTKYDYQISISEDAWTDRNTSTSDYVGFGTYSIFEKKPKKNDYQLSIHATTNPCSQSLTGASSSKKLINGSWGKNDFFERMKNDYVPGQEPICRPSSGGTSYVFCAEQDNKTIMICIDQQTDNPKLAEEIFNTFRWKN